ncbi:MAG TPA: membrane-associated protease 1 [Acetivibrio sp.]|nr:membrane-associated protease 1 [Acetivibrio sp.]
MPIKVTIAGGIVLEKCLDSVYFKVDTSDDLDARTTDIGNTIEITGRVDVDYEPTAGLYSWALIKPTSANKSDVYRKVEVEITSNKDNKLIRKLVFPEAFVVDYLENYSNEDGLGSFTLFLKQKKDNNEVVNVSGS